MFVLLALFEPLTIICNLPINKIKWSPHVLCTNNAGIAMSAICKFNFDANTV